MTVTETELASQPEIWEQVLARVAQVGDALPGEGIRAALIGCGTSYFMAQAASALREQAGDGETDACVASEMPTRRRYGQVVAISRSGTTTEVARALATLPDDVASVAITAVAGTPVAQAADRAIVLDFADERSVVQTRFATAALALLRAHLGADLTPAVAQARDALARPLPVAIADFDHFVFLGHGWTIGLANEAALKFREAALAHTESYYAGEYRHGPISVAGERTLVWTLGIDDPALVHDVRATGATVRVGEDDPMAELVCVQRAAVALAAARGLDPDRPRHLTRSVVLP